MSNPPFTSPSLIFDLAIFITYYIDEFLIKENPSKPFV